nr:DUF5134 domain-containing protein [Kitasatospora sp. SolWspMP-SS2h]
MHQPALISWLLVLLSGAVCVSCLLRSPAPAGGRPGCAAQGPTVRAGGGLVALGMALCSLPTGAVPLLSAPVRVAGWAGLGAAFLIAVARSTVRMPRGPRAAPHLHHAVETAAMLAMVAPAARAGHPMAGMSAPMPPAALTVLFLFYFLADTLWTAARVMRHGPVLHASAQPTGSSAGRSSRLVMDLSMFTMLLAG